MYIYIHDVSPSRAAFDFDPGEAAFQRHRGAGVAGARLLTGSGADPTGSTGRLCLAICAVAKAWLVDDYSS